MELYKILDKKCFSLDLKARTKDDALREIAQLACKSEWLAENQEELIYTKLQEREAQGSTGFGNELALPHTRMEGMEDFLVFIVRSRKGVDFDSLDKKKVKLFFVIIGPPEKVNEHLQILASISRTMSAPRVKNELVKAPTTTALYESFLRNSRLLDSETRAKRKMKLMHLIIYDDDYLYDIMEMFVEEGIDGATVMESSGMGEYVSSIPLFADFISFMKESTYHSKTVMALVPEDKINDVVDGVEKITGDLDKKQGAMVICTDISFYKGSMRMM